jgi:hypothetical protein
VGFVDAHETADDFYVRCKVIFPDMLDATEAPDGARFTEGEIRTSNVIDMKKHPPAYTAKRGTTAVTASRGSSSISAKRATATIGGSKTKSPAIKAKQ